MPDLSIAIVYFSATNVTHTYARRMQAEFQDRGCRARLFNVTPHAARQAPLPLESFDGVVFGFPVFADFAPSVVNDWLPSLEGNGKRCAQFFTYGARTSGYAHFHTRLLLEQAGLRVLFSAEFLGRHSFNLAGWDIIPERPDENDFAVAGQYVALAIERFSQPDPPIFALQKPFGYHQGLHRLLNPEERIERGWAQPVRVSETCSMCGDCQSQCPTLAFDADSGLSDIAKCIECLHCVYICPDQVIQVDPRMKAAYADFLEYWHLSEPMMAAKRSRIIRESWQATF